MATSEAPVPCFRTQRQTFLDLVSHYQRSIEQLEKIAAHLQEATYPRRSYEWNDQTVAVYNNWKRKLCEAQVFANHNSNKPFIVGTNVLYFPVAAIFSKKDNRGRSHLRQQASKNMNRAEHNHISFEKETCCFICVKEIL